MNAPKRITVEQKKACIDDVLDNGVPIHVAVIKHGIPAIVINKWIDVINEEETGVAHEPIAGSVHNSPEMTSTTVAEPVTESVAEISEQGSTAPSADIAASAEKQAEKQADTQADTQADKQADKQAETAESSDVNNPQIRRIKRLLFIMMLSVVCIGAYLGIRHFNEGSSNVLDGEEVTRNPLLGTPITLKVAKRLGIQAEFVDIEETNEKWFDPAKDDIYLKVTSDKFPAKTHVLLPVALAVGTRGIGTSYYQLPFEVTAGDNLSFELLKRDGLPDDQAALLFRSLEAHGFCILQEPKVYDPSEEFLKVLQATESDVLSEVDAETNFIGKLLIRHLRRNALKVLGIASFVVTDDMPSQAADAIELSLADDDKVRMTISLYGPTRLLSSEIEER